MADRFRVAIFEPPPGNVGECRATIDVFADGGVEVHVVGQEPIILAEPRDFPERTNWFDEWMCSEPEWRFDPFRHAPAYNPNRAEVPSLSPEVTGG